MGRGRSLVGGRVKKHEAGRNGLQTGNSSMVTSWVPARSRHATPADRPWVQRAGGAEVAPRIPMPSWRSPMSPQVALPLITPPPWQHFLAHAGEQYQSSSVLQGLCTVSPVSTYIHLKNRETVHVSTHALARV